MLKGFDVLNTRIKEVFEHEVDHGNILLDKSDYRKFQIEARRSSGG